MIKCYVIIGVFRGKVRAKVLYLTHTIPKLIHNKITIIKVIHKPINNLCITTTCMYLPCLVACLLRLQCIPHSTNTTHNALIFDITKDYIYIDTIYYIKHKHAYIERQSLIRPYNSTSHKTISYNGFCIPLI